MTPGEIDGIDQLTGLSDLEVPSVLEVFSAEVTESVHGQIAIFTADCDGEGRNSTKKVVVPIRFLPTDTETAFPAVFIYTGKVAISSTPNSYHDLKLVGNGSAAEMSSLADRLRCRTLEQLKAEFEISRMTSFPKGTIFTYDSVKEIDSQILQVDGTEKNDKSYIMSYETVVDGFKKKGRVYIPRRTYSEAKKSEPGVVVYKGETVSRIGRRYFLLNVIHSLDIPEPRLTAELRP
jgi:hypothetical protein